MVLGLLPLLAALLPSAKVAVMVQQNHAGRAALSDDRFDEAARAFGFTGLVNVFEPWVAPYDRGTTDYLRGEYDDARRLLEDALTDVPPAEQCRVRINLALTHEALGDAARADGDLEQARAGWAQGRDVLAAGGCAEPAQDDADATSVDRRLTKKLADTEEVRPEEEKPPPPPEDDQEADSLDERNQRGETVRRNDDPPPPPPDDGAPVEYHW